MRNIYRFFKLEIDHKRIFGLDLLRFFAIMMVMFIHGNLLLPEYIVEKISLFLIDGVSIFFVLSGFLIGGIFIRSIESAKKIKLKFIFSFWTKRWLRTLPNYYLILTILVLIFLINNRKIEANIIEYYLFIQNLKWPQSSFFPESWSLAVEEWFYLTIPIIILFVYNFLKNLEKTIYYTSFFIILSVSILRYLKFQEIGNINYDLEYRKIVIYRLDSLMYGVAASSFFYYHRYYWKKFKNYLVIIGMLVLLINKIYLNYYSSGFYLVNIVFIIESISIILILPFMYYLQVNNNFFRYLIFHIAMISYSMYLINYSIVQYELIPIINWKNLYIFLSKYTYFAHTIIWLLKYGIFWLLTIFLSTLNYKYFEVPIMKLRDKSKALKK